MCYTWSVKYNKYKYGIQSSDFCSLAVDMVVFFTANCTVWTLSLGVSLRLAEILTLNQHVSSFIKFMLLE